MKTLFGTDGMRGVAGQFPLDVQTVRIVGFSLGLHLQKELGRTPLIVVGRDTRESGPWLESALIAGATSAGAQCERAGVISTPGVAYLTRILPADAGVVISASHNPYYDNGIKIFAPSGSKLDDSTERLIEADILSPLESTGNERDDALDENVSESLQERYLNFLASEIGSSLSLAGLSLVIDCANGAASNLAPELFQRLGAKVLAINNQPDGKNINQDAGSLHLSGLSVKVVSEKADLGMAFDGDADRVLFVDSDGNQADGDATLWVLANYLLDHGQLNHRLVVATVMSNVGLELALRTLGINMVRTDVGDKYVLEELLRLNASLGGEQSGHIIVPRLSLAGDGMITSLCLLRAMQEAGRPLQELTRGFDRYPQVLLNVKVREKRPFAEIQPVASAAAEVEQELAGRGRLLLRYSGTEPLARIMIEGPSQRQIQSQAEKLAEVIEGVLGVSRPVAQ